MTLIVGDGPLVAAGVYTTNQVVAAPVTLCRLRTPSSSTRAVIINSGNANACTGDAGMRDAEEMTAMVASKLGCSPTDVLVMSTGVIGRPMPMDKVRRGIDSAIAGLAPGEEAFVRASTAIMTTDAFRKSITASIEIQGSPYRVAAMAKGAGMIAPNMATMLAVVMTDAQLSPEQCDLALRYGVDRTFNCISVDGHMSTSDTVLLLANGAASGPLSPEEFAEVREAIQKVCQALAKNIIRDAEGADHFITIDVSGLKSRDQAYRMAKEIADSALVKTAVTGGDPNWGRIVSAAGYANVDFDTAFVSLRINGTQVYLAGTPVPFDTASLSKQLKTNRDVHLELSVSGGPCSGCEAVRFWTSDLTQEYVRLNSEYTT